MSALPLYILLSVLFSQIFPQFRYYQAKFLAFLILCLVSFVFSFFFPFKYVFYTSLTLFTVLSIFIILKRKRIDVDGKAELVFLTSFTYFLFLRFLIPDIFGAEKLMDIAFLNSVLKAEIFPPADPFLAGGNLNFYYYFGYVIGAAITLMSFVEAEIGYNIAIASISAYATMLVYGFLRDLVGDRAIFGTVFVLFSGNMYAAYEFFKALLILELPDFLFYWNPTRVIEGTINEFPYFSFIHADFHAHVVAIPVKILFIAILYEYYRGKRFAGITLIPLVFILFITNSWDAPISMLLIAAVIIIKWVGKDVRNRMNEIGFDFFILSTSALLIALFSTTMDLQAAQISFPEDKSDLIQFLMFFSIQLAFAYFYFKEELRTQFFGLAIFSGIVASIFIPIAIAIVPLMLLSAKKALKKDFLAILTLSATFLIFVPEIVVIDTRLNTVFKFYLASWLMLTIPGAMVLSKAIEEKEKALNIILIGLFILTLVYPAIATPLRYHRAEFTLNGMEFVRDWSEGDYEAIRWLKDRDGIIVEEALKCYNYGGRFAAFTGNPTIIAWPGHEVQWRGNGEKLGERMGEVRTIYSSKNCYQILDLLKKYNVSYVIVGYQEKRIYNVDAEKFERCGLREVFVHSNTHILRTE
jgi:YYY domain-containing protein